MIQNQRFSSKVYIQNELENKVEIPNITKHAPLRKQSFQNESTISENNASNDKHLSTYYRI